MTTSLTVGLKEKYLFRFSFKSKVEMRPKFLITTFFAICATWAAHAATPFDAYVAGASLALPVPAGFSEPSSEAPILRSRAELMTVPQMRLLAVFVDDSDLRAVQQGTTPNLKRYFMISVPRANEANSFDAYAFRAVKSEVTGQNQTAANQAREVVKRHTDSVARTIGAQSGFPALSLQIGELRQLGVFHESDSSISTLAVTKVSGADGIAEFSTTMAQATSVVLLNGKIVFLAVYTRVDNDADYLWLREQSESWIRTALQYELK